MFGIGETEKEEMKQQRTKKNQALLINAGVTAVSCWATAASAQIEVIWRNGGSMDCREVECDGPMRCDLPLLCEALIDQFARTVEFDGIRSASNSSAYFMWCREGSLPGDINEINTWNDEGDGNRDLILYLRPPTDRECSFGTVSTEDGARDLQGIFFGPRLSPCGGFENARIESLRISGDMSAIHLPYPPTELGRWGSIHAADIDGTIINTSASPDWDMLGPTSTIIVRGGDNGISVEDGAVLHFAGDSDGRNLQFLADCQGTLEFQGNVSDSSSTGYMYVDGLSGTMYVANDLDCGLQIRFSPICLERFWSWGAFHGTSKWAPR